MEGLLLTTIKDNSVIPSFLELYALHQLTGAAAPTLRHLISTLLPDACQDYAESCLDAVNLARLLLEVKVFWSTGSTVGEHLYGLTSATKSKTGSFQSLTSSEKKLCVISMVLPFALLKLKESSLSFEHDDDSDNTDHNAESDLDVIREKNENNNRRTISSRLATLLQQLQSLKLFLCRVVKREKFSIALMSALYNMSLGAQHLAYLFSLTTSFYPLHQYLGISLIRKKFLSRDARGVSSAVATVTPQKPTIRNHAVTVLFIIAVCFKIAEMLSRNDSSSSGEGGELDDNDVLNTPPEPPEVVNTLCKVPSDPLVCPLCGQPRREPCVSRGGYLFCYSCLWRSLGKHPYCPVTGVRCAVEDIILIKD